MIFAGEQWFALQHLGEDATRAPDIYLDVVFLPCKHDLRSSIVPRRHVAGHLRVLDTGKTKVADFEVTVLVDEDVGGFKIAVNHAG